MSDQIIVTVVPGTEVVKVAVWEDQGAKGDQGDRGLTGSTGPASTVPGPTGPASTVPGPTGPASTVPGPTGPASTVPGPVGAASTVPGPTGPVGAASTIAGPTGPVSTVPGPTGPVGAASTVAGPTGPVSTVPGPTGPQGPTSGRRTPRVYSTTTTTTLIPDINDYDLYTITAQAGPLTVANQGATTAPNNGEQFRLRILDSGTARTLTFDTSYVAKGGILFPTTTVAGKRTELGFEYSSLLSAWILLALAQEV